MSKPKPMSEERLAEIEALIEYEDVDGMRASGPRLIPDLLTEVRRLRAELAAIRDSLVVSVSSDDTTFPADANVYRYTNSANELLDHEVGPRRVAIWFDGKPHSVITFQLDEELAEYRALAERAHELEERRELVDYMNADAIVDELAAMHKEAANGS